MIETSICDCLLAETRSAVGGRPSKQTNKRTIDVRTFINSLSGRHGHATSPTNGPRTHIIPFRPGTDAASTASVLKLVKFALFLLDLDLLRRDAVSLDEYCKVWKSRSAFIFRVKRSLSWTPTHRTPRRNIPEDLYPSDHLLT